MARIKFIEKNEGKIPNTAESSRIAIDAVKASGASLFAVKFDDKGYALDIMPILQNGGGLDVSWRILPERHVVIQYADDLKTGSSSVEREMWYSDGDELKKIMANEFKELEETLQISLENGGWEMKVSAKIQYLDEFDK